MNRVLLRASTSLLILALGGIGAASSWAQCFGPDHLNGPCWQPVEPNLPQFPAAQFSGLGVCWENCDPQEQRDLRLRWSPPSQSACAQYTADLEVFDGGTGMPLANGKMVMDYTRTWEERDPAGNLYQVWRFVTKVDIYVPAGIGPPGCPVPNCIAPPGPHETAFFYGYVDYAQPCGSDVFRNSIVLHHQCDFFIHRPGLSDRPGVFHPKRSWAIVGPHSAATPFVPMYLSAPGGPLVAEAVRPVWLPNCIAEDPISEGDLVPFASGCLCGLTPLPPQHTLSVLNGKATCTDPNGQVSEFASLFLSFPTIPWPHMVSTSIGCWTNDLAYPGKECAFVNEGLFSFHDSCKTVADQPDDFIEVFYGATTIDGWAVVPDPELPPLTQNFVDLADNYTFTVGGPTILPIFGSIRPTDRLIYVNVP